MNKDILILGVPITTTSYHNTLKTIHTGFIKNSKMYVCVSAVHLVMECQKSPVLLKGVQNATIVTPDGMPLVWFARMYGQETSRVYGPNLTKILCKYAEVFNKKVFLLGGAQGQSKTLEVKLRTKFPKIKIVGTQDTPVRPIPEEENKNIIKKINTSQADIVFVGMGCPNQELWMIENRQKLSAPLLIGVGAAFDFITGEVKQAPEWMQNSGLEWLYRLLQEPKRLWKRYVILNTLFIIKVSQQLLRDKFLQRI